MLYVTAGVGVPDAVALNLTFAPQLLRSLLTVILAGQLITGAILTTTVPYPAGLVQPPTFCVTEYVPAPDTVIGFVDAPVFHNMVVPGSVDSPSAVSVEVPLQLLTTLTVGASGIALGADVPEPAGLMQPFTVCVTV